MMETQSDTVNDEPSGLKVPRFKFGIRHLFWLMFLVGLVLSGLNYINLTRRCARAEGYYAIAKHRVELLEEKLDVLRPTWRNEEPDVPPVFKNLPEAAVSWKQID